MNFIKPFKKISQKDTSLVGGKAANLGEMTKAKIPVPPGFVVLASAFEEFLKETDINVEIRAMWNRINIEDIESVEENSEIIRALILKEKMPEEIEKEIFNSYDNLHEYCSNKTRISTRIKKRIRDNFYIAVRSSATAEDSKIDSWAGELETYLNTTKENLIENIKKCWTSLYTPRALFYRVKRGLKRKKVSVAVVVQKMIQSEISGVCFTIHPVTRDKNQMVIEAVWGLGEALVSGQVTPDTYIIEKSQIPNSNDQSNPKSQIPRIKILDINLSKQEKMIARSKKATKEIPVPKSKQSKQKLSEKQIKELADLCLKIEKHYKSPQDIEWALENGKFYIVQTRPVTTL